MPSAKRTWTVILTGGPCAGKSTAIVQLRDRLLGLGVHVITVPECATTLLANSGGYDAGWAKQRKKHLELQRVFLQAQISTEKSFQQIAQLRDKPTVILCDRGVFDGKSFLEPSEWEELLSSEGHTEEQLLTRYDCVVHLVTAAIGATEHYEWGPGSQNPERYHGPEQAAAADLLGRKSYSSHQSFKVIDNSTDFSTKVTRCLQAICEQLELPRPSQHRRRFKVSQLSDSELSKHVQFQVKDQKVWFKKEEGVKGLESQLRRTKWGQSTEEVFSSAERFEQTGGKWVVTERLLDEAQYHTQKKLGGYEHVQKIPIRKRVRSFIFDNRYWELSEYFDQDQKERKDREQTLDVELYSAVDKVSLPPFFVDRTKRKTDHQRDKHKIQKTLKQHFAPKEAVRGHGDDLTQESSYISLTQEAVNGHE